MKNLARLLIFFSLVFVVVFIFVTLLYFLSSWIDAVRVVSQNPEQADALITSAKRALPVTLFIVILLSLSYSVRRKIHAVLSIITVFVLSVAFCAGFFIGIERVEVYDPTLQVPDKMGSRAGLILSQLDTDIILLRGDPVSGSMVEFPRVIAFPELPLVYQETALGPRNTVLSLPLEGKAPWFMQSILMDFSLITRELESRFGDGLFSFIIFGAALLLLLASLRFILELSSWPMANLFLGALVFRLILSLVIFLGTREVMDFLMIFADGRFPEFLVAPGIFLILGALILLYTFLVTVARKRRADA